MPLASLFGEGFFPVYWGEWEVREEDGAGPNQRQVAEVDINKNNVFSLGIYIRTG